MSLAAGKEGPELPPSRPTMAATHPQIASQGQAIIETITKLSNPDNNWHEGNYSVLVAQLPALFDQVSEFVGGVLTSRGPNDGVAYWPNRPLRLFSALRNAPGQGSLLTGLLSLPGLLLRPVLPSARPGSRGHIAR